MNPNASLQFAQELLALFRNSGAAAVVAARHRWRSLDASVLDFFNRQAAAAGLQATSLADEQIMALLLAEIAQSRGSPAVGPNLKSASMAIFQQLIELGTAARLVVQEGPASMQAARAFMATGAPYPQYWVGLAAAMALPATQVEALATSGFAPSPTPAPSPRAQTDEAANQAILAALRARLERDIADGRVPPERAPALRRILDDLGEVQNMPAGSLNEQMVRLSRQRQVVEVLLGLMAQKTIGDPAHRSSRVYSLLTETCGLLLSQAFRPLTPTSVHEAISDLLVRTGPFERRLAEIGADDAGVLALEANEIRASALQAKRLVYLEHAAIVDPIWACPNFQRNPNAVFFSGGPPVRELVAARCARRRLTLLDRSDEGEPAQARFDQLRACHVAVFDLTVPPGPGLAAVCYELGTALVLGVPTVVVARAGAEAPFDIDVTPTFLADGRSEADQRRVGAALDRALLGLQRAPGRGFVETVDAVARRYEKSSVPYAAVLLKELQGFRDDPPRALSVIENLLGLDTRTPPLLVFGTWPARYPDGTRRLFHATPFGPTWASGVKERVRRACGQLAVYRRHDDVKDARIVRSLWEELGQATDVLVDLTGFNANVAIELGIAHALGRRTLMVAQEGSTTSLFVNIRKLRVTLYGLSDNRLEAAIRGHLEAGH